MRMEKKKTKDRQSPRGIAKQSEKRRRDAMYNKEFENQDKEKVKA
jgi:hypothetical protein